MPLRAWRFATLVLAALAMTMEFAHVLELPQKMRYDAAMYSAVNTTLYRYFALVGGPLQVASIAAAFVLAFTTRGQPAFRWTLVGACFLLAAFLAWLTVVAPVNGRVADALRAAPDSVPALWLELRYRWEYGHAAGFVLQLAGFAALVASVLVDTPRGAGRPHRAAATGSG